MAGKRGALMPITTQQFAVHEIFVTVESDGSQLSTNEGQGEVTSTQNATGDYTIAITQPGERLVCPRCPIPETANLQCQLVSASASSVRYKFTNNSGTATDTRFHVGIVISDDPIRRIN